MIGCLDSIHFHNLSQDIQVVIEKIVAHVQPEDAFPIDDVGVAVQRGFRNDYTEGPMQSSTGIGQHAVHGFSDYSIHIRWKGRVLELTMSRVASIR